MRNVVNPPVTTHAGPSLDTSRALDGGEAEGDGTT